MQGRRHADSKLANKKKEIIFFHNLQPVWFLLLLVSSCSQRRALAASKEIETMAAESYFFAVNSFEPA